MPNPSQHVGLYTHPIQHTQVATQPQGALLQRLSFNCGHKACRSPTRAITVAGARSFASYGGAPAIARQHIAIRPCRLRHDQAELNGRDDGRGDGDGDDGVRNGDAGDVVSYTSPVGRDDHPSERGDDHWRGVLNAPSRDDDGVNDVCGHHDDIRLLSLASSTEPRWAVPSRRPRPMYGIWTLKLVPQVENAPQVSSKSRPLFRSGRGCRQTFVDPKSTVLLLPDWIRRQ